jgi:lipoprotein-releasing system permease protein
LELKLKSDLYIPDIKKKIQAVCGDEFKVLDRYEQQSETFNIMKIEKLIAYIFLTFILVVASFNIIGSLSMLVIDKREDSKTLRALGARDSLVKKIFLFEGWLISIIGAVLGVGIGLLLCLLQQQYGMVRLGDSDGSFIVDAYPVSVHYIDVLGVFATVVIIGFISSLVTLRIRKI